MIDTSHTEPARTAPSPVRWVQIAFAVLGLGLTGLIVWASLNADIGQSFGTMVQDPWGLVALVDLYLGFAIFAVFVFLVDGVRPASFVWIALLMVLGNILAVLWLVLRLPTLVVRLRG